MTVASAVDVDGLADRAQLHLDVQRRGRVDLQPHAGGAGAEAGLLDRELIRARRDLEKAVAARLGADGFTGGGGALVEDRDDRFGNRARRSRR